MAVTQAEEALRIVRNRYQNGLFTIVDLLNSELALQQAHTNYLQAVHDYKVANASLMLPLVHNPRHRAMISFLLMSRSLTLVFDGDGRPDTPGQELVRRDTC